MFLSVVILNLCRAEDGVMQLPQRHRVQLDQQHAREFDQFNGGFRKSSHNLFTEQIGTWSNLL